MTFHNICDSCRTAVVLKNHIKSCARPNLNQVNAVMRTVVIVAVTKAWPYV